MGGGFRASSDLADRQPNAQPPAPAGEDASGLRGGEGLYRHAIGGEPEIQERQAGPAAWSRLLQMFGLLAERLLAPSARRDFEELLFLPPKARSRRLVRARSRFRSAALVRLLLDESWSQLFQEAARRDELTVEKARKVAAYLREARTGEARGFSWGGGR